MADFDLFKEHCFEIERWMRKSMQKVLAIGFWGEGRRRFMSLPNYLKAWHCPCALGSEFWRKLGMASSSLFLPPIVRVFFGGCQGSKTWLKNGGKFLRGEGWGDAVAISPPPRGSRIEQYLSNKYLCKLQNTYAPSPQKRTWFKRLTDKIELQGGKCTKQPRSIAHITFFSSPAVAASNKWTLTVLWGLWTGQWFSRGKTYQQCTHVHQSQTFIRRIPYHFWRGNAFCGQSCASIKSLLKKSGPFWQAIIFCLFCLSWGVWGKTYWGFFGAVKILHQIGVGTTRQGSGKGGRGSLAWQGGLSEEGAGKSKA